MLMARSEIRNSFGRRLARAREAKPMTQDELGRALNVDATLISRWENDRSKPRAENIAALARALGVRTDWLLSNVGAMREQAIR